MIIELAERALDGVSGGVSLGLMLNPPYAAVLAAQALLDAQEQLQDSSTASSGSN